MEELQKLIRDRDAVEDKIVILEDAFHEINARIIAIVGACKLCKNWHYPHCGPKQPQAP